MRRSEVEAHQVLLTDGSDTSTSGYVSDALATVDGAFEGRVTRWSLDPAQAFIEQHFAADVAWAFEVLRPYSYKADLLKLCLLHQVGGWVVDAGVQLLQPPTVALDDDPDLVLFRATGPMSAAWSCSMALVYAVPGHPVFARAIERIVDHCHRQYYGYNPLAPTMAPLGRSLAELDVVERVRLGNVVDVEGQPYGRAYHLPGVGLIAARKPKGVPAGDVASIGLHGGNDYVAMWRDREVYASLAPPGSTTSPVWYGRVIGQGASRTARIAGRRLSGAGWWGVRQLLRRVRGVLRRTKARCRR